MLSLSRIIVFILVVLLSADMLWAAATPEDQCAADMNLAAGKYAQCIAGDIYSIKPASCERTLTKKWGKLESKYGNECPSDWNQDKVQSLLDSCNTAIEEKFESAEPGSAKKLNQAAGKLAKCLAKAEGKFLIKGDQAAYDKMRAKCEANFSKAWRRTTAKYDADQIGNWDRLELQDFIDSCSGTINDAVIGQSTNVVPLLECITRNNDGSVTADFGYESFEQENVEIPIGLWNGFAGKQPDISQPTLFEPGLHENVFSVTFRGVASWTLGEKTVVADRSSEWCEVQPETPTECEATLRSTLLTFETLNDLFLSQIEAANNTYLAQANDFLDISTSSSLQPDASLVVVESLPESLCGIAIDSALQTLVHANGIAQYNTVSLQQQMTVLLDAVLVEAIYPVSTNSSNLPLSEGASTDVVTTPVIAPAYTISEEAFGDFLAWATSVLVDYLRKDEQISMSYAEGILKIAARPSIEFNATSVGDASEFQLDSNDSPPFPVGATVDVVAPIFIVEDEILKAKYTVALSGTHALGLAWENAVYHRQQMNITMLAVIASAANKILDEGRGLNLDLLAIASGRDMTPFLGINIPPVVVPDLSVPGDEYTDLVNEFLDLLEENNDAFHTSMGLLNYQATSFAGRLIDYVLALRPALLQGSSMTTGDIIGTSATANDTLAEISASVVPPDLTPEEMALLNTLFTIANASGLSMQNAVSAQHNLNIILNATTVERINQILLNE